MAGTDARFNAAEFRNAIKFAMRMGAPEETTERVTFRWTTEKTFDTADASGDPFSWTAAADTTDAPDDVQVDVAVDFNKPNSTDGTSVAEFNTTSAVLTLLDVDYEQIFSDGRRADQVIIDDDRYDIAFVAPPYALFDVTVYDLYIKSIDES